MSETTSTPNSTKPNTQIHSPSKQFTIPISSDRQVTIHITEPAVRAQGLDLTTWTASWVLAGQLHELDIPGFNAPTSKRSATDEGFPDSTPSITNSASTLTPTSTIVSENIIPILELGAGTGLVGLTASILYGQPVILTDLEPIVAGLEANVAINKPLLDNYGAAVHCGSLDWVHPENLSFPSGSQKNIDNATRHRLESYTDPSAKVHLLLAADTIYSEEHPELLVNTILFRLARLPTARLVLTYPLRVAYLDHLREMWERLEAGGLTCVEEGKIDATPAGKDDGVDNKKDWNGDWDDELLCEWCVWKWKD